MYLIPSIYNLVKFMKNLKILILCILSVCATQFAYAGVNSSKDNNPSAAEDTAVTSSNQASPLDIVTDLNDIQNIIRQYLDEWYLSQKITPHKAGINHTGCVMAICVTQDGKKIISGSYDKTVKTSDFIDGRISNSKTIITIKNDIAILAITYDNTMLIISCGGGSLSIWDFKTHKLIKELADSCEFIGSIAITRDNKKCVTGSSFASTTRKLGYEIKIWDLKKGKLLNVLLGHTGHVYSIVITSDDKKFFSGSYDGTIRIWELNSGKLLEIIPQRSRLGVKSLAICDNKYLVATYNDKTIKICDINNYAVIRNLEWHDDHINSLITINNTKKIVSATDKQIKICDVNTGSLSQTLEYTDRLTALAITPDEKTIIAGFLHGSLIIWRNLARELEKQSQVSKKEDKKVNPCAQCNKENCSLRCTGCKTIFYCSAACQKLHWQTHKNNCKSK